MPDIVGQHRASWGRLRLMLSGSTPATKLSVDQLLDRFAKGTPRQRRPLIKQVETRAEELAAVGPDLLSGFRPSR